MNLAGSIVSQLTPAGRGAVASILVAGPSAVAIVSRCFSPASGKPLEQHAGGLVLFGNFRGPARETEELVVALHGPDRVEIHPHGGSFAAAAVMQALVHQGARAISWQEAAAILETDSIAAEARIALAEAKTEKSAMVLLDQFQGALRSCVNEIIAAVERNDRSSLAELERLLALAPLGPHLTQPWRVVIAGPPNVGKSSLMNALVGFQRSIVFNQPGTTRDLLTALTALDGWPIELVDTAGLRESRDDLEAAGVARAIAGLNSADLILLVRDATAANNSDAGVVAPFPATIPVIAVGNKLDLLPAATRIITSESSLVSALTGEGLESLCERIVQTLVPHPPARGQAIPFTFRQQQSLLRAAAALCAGETADAIASLRAI